MRLLFILFRPVIFLFIALPLVSHAGLNVIADLGGEDAAPFFTAINKQPASASPPPVLPATPPGLSAMLSVTTPEMTPGAVEDRPLQLPGIGALFLVGDDPRSRAWLQASASALLTNHAAGMIVNVNSAEAVQELRDLVPGVPLVPASGSELARRLQLQHYPVLITDSGLSQKEMQP